MINAEKRRAVALGILNQEQGKLTRKSGSFLGQIVADAQPLTPKQADWFLKLAERAGIEMEALDG